MNKNLTPSVCETQSLRLIGETEHLCVVEKMKRGNTRMLCWKKIEGNGTCDVNKNEGF